MNKVIVLLALLGACAPSLKNVNLGGLIVSEASLACDAGQTYRAASMGWAGKEEANPILGKTPSQGEVASYFVSTMIVNAVVWAVLPKSWKLIYSGAVTAIQTKTIFENQAVGMGVCGIR